MTTPTEPTVESLEKIIRKLKEENAMLWNRCNDIYEDYNDSLRRRIKYLSVFEEPTE